MIKKGPLVSLGDEDFVLKAVIEGTALMLTMAVRSLCTATLLR